ncbi:hypothetical protein D8M36_00970 [Dermabacter sp. HSID17554]|nr:hypothetical protein D8M36_00970 [Dermabacter sp. HSID17554]
MSRAPHRCAWRVEARRAHRRGHSPSFCRARRQRSSSSYGRYGSSESRLAACAFRSHRGGLTAVYHG